MVLDLQYSLQNQSKCQFRLLFAGSRGRVARDGDSDAAERAREATQRNGGLRQRLAVSALSVQVSASTLQTQEVSESLSSQRVQLPETSRPPPPVLTLHSLVFKFSAM